MTLAIVVQFIGALSVATVAAIATVVTAFLAGAMRGVDAAIVALMPGIYAACVVFGLTFWSLMP